MMCVGKGFLPRAVKFCWIFSCISQLTWLKSARCLINAHTRCLASHYSITYTHCSPKRHRGLQERQKAYTVHVQVLHVVKLRARRLMDALLPKTDTPSHHALVVGSNREKRHSHNYREQGTYLERPLTRAAVSEAPASMGNQSLKKITVQK